MSQGAAHLRLAPGQRRVEFFFTAPAFTKPETIAFKYRLFGLDADWIDGGALRSATYAQIPPGHYRFEVTACNSDGVWNETGAALDLTAEPYWWETAWFRMLGPLAAAGLLGGGILLGLRRRHRRQIERLKLLGAVDRERARIAADLHDDLGASLTEVAVLADTGQHAPAADKAPGLFKAIGGKSRQMVAALDAIVWAVDPEEDSLQSLVDYLAGFAGDFLAASGIACRFRIPVAFPAITLPGNVRHELFMLVKETLHNAVQHAGASEVMCHMAFEQPLLLISIADNGTGFDVSAPPDGHGLRNFAERLNKLGGNCAIDSRPGRGTTVNITLRVGNPSAATLPPTASI